MSQKSANKEVVSVQSSTTQGFKISPLTQIIFYVMGSCLLVLLAIVLAGNAGLWPSQRSVSGDREAEERAVTHEMWKQLGTSGSTGASSGTTPGGYTGKAAESGTQSGDPSQMALALAKKATEAALDNRDQEVVELCTQEWLDWYVRTGESETELAQRLRSELTSKVSSETVESVPLFEYAEHKIYYQVKGVVPESTACVFVIADRGPLRPKESFPKDSRARNSWWYEIEHSESMSREQAQRSVEKFLWRWTSLKLVMQWDFDASDWRVNETN